MHMHVVCDRLVLPAAGPFVLPWFCAHRDRPLFPLQQLWQVLQVLRFHACWDDSRRPYGDKMPFVIHYYLADHTMEVREVRLRNDGRDPFPLLVRRMPIPKKVRSHRPCP